MMNYSDAKRILEKQDAAKAVLAQYDKLANAHEGFGFQTRREFIKALQEIEQAGKKGGPRAGGGRGKRGLSPDTISQIQKLKGEGKSNAEISRTLGVSPLTVGKYVRAAAGKGTAKPAAKAGAGRGRARRSKAKAKA